MKIVNKNISDLIPAEYNPRTLSADQREQISASLKRFGFVDPVIVNTHADRKNIIVGGHMRTRVAKEELGLTEVPCVEVELTLDQERELNIRLNKNSGEWDFEALGNYFEIDELTEWGFDPGELDLCLEDEEETEVEEDDFDEEPPEEPKTDLGRIYQLGKHRLMCGDSTSEADVKRLMNGESADMVFTDPPYGMSLDTDYTKMPSVSKDGNKNYRKVIGDFDDFTPKLISTVFDNFGYCKEIFMFGSDYFAELLENKNQGSWIVWDKRVTENFDAMIGSAFELCWSKNKHKREIARFNNTLFSGEADAKNKIHPTQKPIKLINWFFDKWGKTNDIVVDLFGGSGSTLIAADQAQRQCRMMELDPKYCDVIVKRYCKLKGIDPEEVFETGVAK